MRLGRFEDRLFTGHECSRTGMFAQSECYGAGLLSLVTEYSTFAHSECCDTGLFFVFTGYRIQYVSSVSTQ